MTTSPAVIRSRRSALYVPASNARAIDKARTLDADVVILDLEDAVLAEAKERARAAVVEAVAAGGFDQREVVIRVNGTDTPWGADDLAAVARIGADGVLFPKVTGERELGDAIRMLDRAGGATLPVWVMAELPGAVLGLEGIAGLAPRLACVVIGTEDLARALRIVPGRDRLGLLPALGHCVLAARAHGVDILDGIFTDLRDEAGLRDACLQGKALGFDGKTLIHPAQIAIANEIFGVTSQTAAEAVRVVAAWESAAAEGRGIAVLDGRMVERLHAEEARRILELTRGRSPGTTKAR